MTHAPGKAAPLRFLIGIALCWSLGRVAVVVAFRPAALEPLPSLPAAVRRNGVVRTAVTSVAPPSAGPQAQARVGRRTVGPQPRIVMADVDVPPASADARVPSNGTTPDAEPVILPVAAALPGDPGADPRPTPASASRLRGSAWAFLRGGGDTVAPLSPQGRIGGGQAGVRLLYALDHDRRLAASGRVSRAIGGPRQTEAALGLDVQPAPSVPVHLTVERRIAIDHGGRDAWSAGVSGGVYALAVAHAVRLDGYGQAGVVGARRRDLYVDGAVRVGRELPVGESGATLTLGGGAWGAAQPRAARLDVGPSAVLRVPLARTTLAAAVDYRGRLAGDARPGSGPALTIGMDF